MKRSIVTALACGVWLSATASAAALTYEMHRPLVLSAPPPGAAAEMAPPLDTTASLLDRALPSVLHVHEVTVVRPAPRHAAHAPVSAPAVPRDIETMSCTAWRELDIGSGRVEVCQ